MSFTRRCECLKHAHYIMVDTRVAEREKKLIIIRISARVCMRFF